MLCLWYLHIQVTHVWWGETLGRERTSLMLLQLVSSPICNVIFVIFTHTSDSQRGSLVCVNITKITLQMGLDTSCNNIKDVLSMPTVSPHQTWVTCMCKYHKKLVSSPSCNVIFVIFTHTSGPRLIRGDCRQGKDLFIVFATCVQSHLLCYFYITNGTGHKL
jgi:hypothetical protein